MTSDKNRYFIELQMDGEFEVPRNREAEIRRAQATQFIDQIAHWLMEEELNDKVASMAVTALGQVQITCEQDIISRMRGDENLNIAVIRRGGALTDSIQRIGPR
ncbi:MAG: hypothetical protein WCD70_12925 [Alphaproteobacteria bacterium]